VRCATAVPKIVDYVDTWLARKAWLSATDPLGCPSLSSIKRPSSITHPHFSPFLYQRMKSCFRQFVSLSDNSLLAYSLQVLKESKDVMTICRPFEYPVSLAVPEFTRCCERFSCVMLASLPALE